MSETQSPSPVTPATPPSFLERWGPAAAVTLLGLLALELAVLTPLVRYGVDLSGLIGWVNGTFGSSIALSGGQPSWPLALGIAWAITRPLKPLQLGAAAVITPVVGQWVGVPKGDAPR